MLCSAPENILYGPCPLNSCQKILRLEVVLRVFNRNFSVDDLKVNAASPPQDAEPQKGPCVSTCCAGTKVTDSDIKRAFRKAAMTWHPDRRDDLPDAERDSAHRQFQVQSLLLASCAFGTL